MEVDEIERQEDLQQRKITKDPENNFDGSEHAEKGSSIASTVDDLLGIGSYSLNINEPFLCPNPVIRAQRKDGNCLFHAVAYWIRKAGHLVSGQQLREQAAKFIADNPRFIVSGSDIEK